MTAAKHTPGPWRLTSSGTVIVSVEHGRICEAPKHMQVWNWEPNSRLIIAAPGLLDALEELADIASVLEPTCMADARAKQRRLERARAAIALYEQGGAV